MIRACGLWQPMIVKMMAANAIESNILFFIKLSFFKNKRQVRSYKHSIGDIGIDSLMA
jgi:HJR/Mrr/RecB family endonuclease